MTRVSQISAPGDFEIEGRREELRDRRWKRHRNMLFSIALVIAVVGLGTPWPPLLPVLLRWL